jgi:hypothetical protein
MAHIAAAAHGLGDAMAAELSAKPRHVVVDRTFERVRALRGRKARAMSCPSTKARSTP